MVCTEAGRPHGSILRVGTGRCTVRGLEAAGATGSGHPARSSEAVEAVARDSGPDFNASLMVLTPKKSAEHTGEGTPFYSPSNMRPIIVNCENRILANTVRLRLEPLLAP